MLCDKMATQAHLNTRRHQYGFERPEQYGRVPHDARMPLPRDDDIRWRCQKAMEDNSYMTLEKAEAILNERAKAKGNVKGQPRQQVVPTIAAAEKEEPVLIMRTIFNDAGDNPTTYLKITILERRLQLNKITKQEFRNQHPRGVKRPRESHLEGQDIFLGEYAWTHDITPMPAMNGAVALITDYVDGLYTVSLMGKHRGQHVENLRIEHLERIRKHMWEKLYTDDQFLLWDIRGVDEGIEFPTCSAGRSA